jgi:hypothetical protein
MDYEKYKMPEGSYPDRPSKPMHPARGKETSASVKEYALAYEKYEDAMLVFRKKMDEYRQADAALTEKFWKDAFEELGIPENHPKASLLRDKAWSHGHANGLHEVFFWLDDLWELAK